MAKPDCDDGFMMLAHELFAALATAGFTKWEWVVIREVLGQVYGPRRTRTATILPSEVAGRIGTFKQSIMRAVAGLVAAGVLARVGEMEYRFVKDYEAWDVGLTDREAAYCRQARTVNPSTSAVNNGAYPLTSAVNNGAYRVSAGAYAASTDALTNVSAGAYETVPPQTPLDGREEGEGGENSRPLAPAGGSDPEADRVCRLFEEVGGDVAWAMWCSSRIKLGDTPATLEAALQEAVDTCTPKGETIHLKYIGTIAARYGQEGIPKPAIRGKGRKGIDAKPQPSTNGADLPHVPRIFRDDKSIPEAESMAIFKRYAK